VARTHYTGVLITRAEVFHRSIDPLFGTVTVRHNNGAPTKWTLTTKEVAPLDLLTKGTISDDDLVLDVHDAGSRASAVVLLKDATFAELSQSKLVWTVKQNDGQTYAANLAYSLAWDVPNGAKLTVQTPFTTDVIELLDGDTVYIYNFDSPNPGADGLSKQESCSAHEGEDIVDHDFKWLYQLVKPKGKTLKEWLGAQRPLPAPASKCPEKGLKGDELPPGGEPTPEVSTCFPATWAD
jgi:hypothetical protein